MRLTKAKYEKAKAKIEEAKGFTKTVEEWEAAVVRCGPQYKGLDVTAIELNDDGSIKRVDSKPIEVSRVAVHKTA